MLFGMINATKTLIMRTIEWIMIFLITIVYTRDFVAYKRLTNKKLEYRISNMESRILDFLRQTFNKYKVESILIVVAALMGIVSLFIFLKGESITAEENIISHTKDDLRQEIYIDISGAVKKPGVYKLLLGDRLEHAVAKASGLSEQADRDFFAKNFNLARRLKDQEKYYIPSISDIGVGMQNYNQTVETEIQESSKIDLNSSDIDSLDSLPGIGQVTAQKIIDNRPYNSIDELLSRKIIGKSVYEKIKDQLVISNK